jgi:hypothetical protein
MTLSSTSIRVRLSIAGVLFVVLGFVYVRALAAGYGAGTFRAFAHPWHDVFADALLFLSATALFLCLLPLWRSAVAWHRVAAGLLLVLPGCILAHLVVWLIKVYAHNAA